MGQADAGGKTQDTAKAAQQRAFTDEKHYDISLCGAQGSSQPNLLPPFGHVGQHNVHDTDAAHKKGNRGERAHDPHENLFRFIMLSQKLMDQTKVIKYPWAVRDRIGSLLQVTDRLPVLLHLGQQQSQGITCIRHFGMVLYHVPEQDAAVAEIVRVLRPGGRLLAATNSKTNMAELRALQATVINRLASDDEDPERYFPSSLAFNLEDGATLLGRHFAQVERHDLPGALVFPRPQPVIDYIGSIRGRLHQRLPEGVTWQEVEELLRQELSHHIADHGEFRVNKLAGVFVCTKKI